MNDDETVNKAMNDFVAGVLIFFIASLVAIASYELFLIEYFVAVSPYFGELSSGCESIVFSCREDGGRSAGWALVFLPLIALGVYVYLKFVRPHLKRRDLVP